MNHADEIFGRRNFYKRTKKEIFSRLQNFQLHITSPLHYLYPVVAPSRIPLRASTGGLGNRTFATLPSFTCLAYVGTTRPIEAAREHHQERVHTHTNLVHNQRCQHAPSRYRRLSPRQNKLSIPPHVRSSSRGRHQLQQARLQTINFARHDLDHKGGQPFSRIRHECDIIFYLGNFHVLVHCRVEKHLGKVENAELSSAK